MAEKNGEISGVGCNVFDLAAGKDFVLVVKEIQTGDETYPDYKMSMFKPETTSLPIYFKEKQAFKNAPLNDGKIESTVQGKIREFLLDREHDLEEFSPKHLDEKQQAKITEITNFLTGKASSSFAGAKESKPTSSDFEFEDNFTKEATTTSSTEEEDDFFNDL
jgi:hypothetical protein